MSLDRTFTHDRDTYKSTEAEIEALLTVAEQEGAAEPIDDLPEPAAEA